MPEIKEWLNEIKIHLIEEAIRMLVKVPQRKYYLPFCKDGEGNGSGVGVEGIFVCGWKLQTAGLDDGVVLAQVWSFKLDGLEK